MYTRTNGQWLELKIPPVALVIIMALLMWLGAPNPHGLKVQLSLPSIVAGVFGFLGASACSLGLFEFKRSKTTINPTRPQASSSLVRTGIYRHTRNPMYLGFVLILAGWATLMGTILSFFGLAAFVIYMNRFQIKPEERALASLFGDEFKEYRSNVRKWI